METTKKKTEKTQGVETVQERNPSLSYTIKSLSGNIKKLKKLKAATEEELSQLIAIHKNLLNKYIGGELDL